MSAPELSVAICTHNPQTGDIRRVIDAIVPQLKHRLQQRSS